MSDVVKGCCPMGCGTTLYLSVSGHIACTAEACPRPNAAAEILGDCETEHLVEVNADGFTVRHPLRERLDNALLACDLHAAIRRQAGPPVKPGRYRVHHSDRTLTWDKVTAR